MDYQYLALAQTTKVSTTKPAQDNQFSKYTNQFMTPQGMSIIGGIGVLLILQMFGAGNKKNKIASGYWGSGKENCIFKEVVVWVR